MTIAGHISEIDNSDATSTSVVLRLASSAATAAEGSQCSSSCSTVVVVNTSAGGTSRIRRASATSSLELGYSHTAQNSAISSETASFPGAIYDRCKKTGKYTGERIRRTALVLEMALLTRSKYRRVFLKSRRPNYAVFYYIPSIPISVVVRAQNTNASAIHAFHSFSQIKHGHVA